MKVLVAFSQKQELPVYKELCSALQDKNIPYDLMLCSPHHNPEVLDRLLKKDLYAEGYHVVAAGSSGSAHLPSLIAARTHVTVIGIPVAQSFHGIDALLSLLQSPHGTSVLCAGINNARYAAEVIEHVLFQEFEESVALIGNQDLSSVKKCTELLTAAHVPFAFHDAPVKGNVNIAFFDLVEEEPCDDHFCINVPCSSSSTNVGDALHLTEKSRRGIFVGLNKGDNAALAALKLLNKKHQHSPYLEQYRMSIIKTLQQHAKKPMEEDHGI
ncbi:AIR carboxylase family protein [Candidatus Woesearchaeota archaeon]|nr:AIR carboxylase family protein [Candidatus Woesearchaeota archaeon]